MVFRFSYSTRWGVFCKIKEKTTIEYRLCCWTSLKLLTLGWRRILPNMYAFVSLKKFFFHIFGDVKYVHDQYCQFTDSRGSLMVLGHWWSWVTDVIGSLMVLGPGSSTPGRLTGGHLSSGRLLIWKREGRRRQGMEQLSINTPNPICRLCWCLIEFIDWRYSQ